MPGYEFFCRQYERHGNNRETMKTRAADNQENFFIPAGMPFAELRRSTNSGRHFKPHLHHRFSIGAVDAGEVIYDVAGTKAVLGPGSLALINPGTLHFCNPREKKKRNYLILYLDSAWCGRVQAKLWRQQEFLPVDTVLLAHEHLYREFLALAAMFTGENTEKNALAPALAEFIQAVFLRCCNPEHPDTSPPDRQPHIEEIKSLLADNIAAPLSLEQLARQLSVNPYTLLRRFKTATGITPHAFRLNCRISKARKLLRRGMEPAQVALECGFFDQSHLHRHFKAMTTVTPGEYQQNFL